MHIHRNTSFPHLRYFTLLVMGEMYFLLDIVVTSEDFWAMGMRGIRIKKSAFYS